MELIAPTSYASAQHRKVTNLNELHLFAGAGGGILGGMLLGHTPVCAVEIEQYPRRVLLQRQRDGLLPRFPIWDDVQTFDGKPWRGSVDVVCGGFPCQDISAAGKGAGIAGERSGLWGEMARVIREIRPRYAFVENSPMLTSRGLGRVLGDLAEMGYDAKWCVLGACDAGAPHKRDRIWILGELANANSRGCSSDGQRSGLAEICEKRADQRVQVEKSNMADSGSGRGSDNELCAGRDESRVCCAELADSDEQRAQVSFAGRFTTEQVSRRFGGWWEVDPAELCDTSEQGLSERPEGAIQQPGTLEESERSTGDEENRPAESIVGRVAHGVANRVDRLKAIGNGQVPQCAAMAFTILSA
jgi:DNA (cytosine-5)-methyltransferase 1